MLRIFKPPDNFSIGFFYSILFYHTSSAHNVFIPYSAYLCSSTILSLIAHTPYGERRGKKSLLFVRFWWKIAHICKIENKLGNRHELFSIFFIGNELFTKKGVRGYEPNGRMVQPTQLIIISIEAQFCALQKFSVFFLTSFSFSSCKLLFRKINFCLKNWNSRRRIFSEIKNLKKKKFFVTL